MPKLKTIKAAKKRFRLTASGRAKCRRAQRGHHFLQKTTKQKRRLRSGNNVLTRQDSKMVRRMLVKQGAHRRPRVKPPEEKV